MEEKRQEGHHGDKDEPKIKKDSERGCNVTLEVYYLSR